jgi:hypothetical protein
MNGRGRWQWNVEEKVYELDAGPAGGLSGFLVMYKTTQGDVPVGLFAGRESADELAQSITAPLREEGLRPAESYRRMGRHPAVRRAFAGYRDVSGGTFIEVTVVEFRDGRPVTDAD